MNFVNNNDYYLGTPGQQKSKAIKNFVFSNDQKFIIINYLDGTQDVKPNTESKINEILKLMLEQALCRDMDYYVSPKDKSEPFLNAAAIAVGSIFLFGVPILWNFHPVDQPPMENYLMTVLYGLAATILSHISSDLIESNRKSNNRKEELKKYKIFLEMIDKYQEIPQYSADTLWLYKEIENLKEKLEPMGYLCINTLDNFTLEDIKKIAQRLEKHNNQKTNGPVRRRVQEPHDKNQ